MGGRRPYLQIGAVVAFGAAILGAGYFGPHPGTPAASGTAGLSPTVAASGVAAATASPSESGPTLPLPSPAIPAPQLEALLGARLIGKAAGETVTLLPLQISSGVPARVGDRLFYVVGGDQVETSVAGQKTDPFTLVTTPHCKAINQIAAAGDSLLFLVSWPDGPNPTTGGCDGFTTIDWSLQVMNVQTGKGRELATGQRAKIAPHLDGFPIHFALTTTAYAFDRPESETAPGGPENVEVRSFDGKTSWTTRTTAHVVQLGLAGDRLMVVTEPSFPTPGPLSVSVATSRSPALEVLGEPATGASISEDGRYVAWDAALHSGPAGRVITSDVLVYDAASGTKSSVAPPAMAQADHVFTMHPTVSSTAAGPFVAWLVVVDTTVYPMFSWPGKHESGFLDSLQEPMWIDAAAGSLVWIAESADGWTAVAYTAEVAKL